MQRLNSKGSLKKRRPLWLVWVGEQFLELKDIWHQYARRFRVDQRLRSPAVKRRGLSPDFNRIEAGSRKIRRLKSISGLNDLGKNRIYTSSSKYAQFVISSFVLSIKECLRIETTSQNKHLEGFVLYLHKNPALKSKAKSYCRQLRVAPNPLIYRLSKLCTPSTFRVHNF